MISVARRTVTDDLRIYFGVALLRAFKFFEHINPRALAEHHTRPIACEWARSAMRLIVPLGGEHGQKIESRKDPGRQRRINPACDHCLLSAQRDVFSRLMNGIS